MTETIQEKVLLFKERKLKAKEVFTLKEITKKEAYNFILKFHYLGEAKFFSKYNHGIFIDDVLVGAATYSNPQGISALKSWFNLSNDVQDIVELSRLCVLPELNGSNATSYLLGNSIKKLKTVGVRAVITLADDSRHVGSIYQVCNFKYYGLTNKKTDFYTYDGRLNPRGETKDLRGVWLPRTRKHRYGYILDPTLKCILTEQDRPNILDTNFYNCCNKTNIVYDKRFNEWYTCPRCTGKLELLEPKQ
jgi:hypothetical protein